MKRTIIDTEARTEHHVLSGSTFLIDRRLERKGGNIFLDRNYVRHPTITGCRSLLLPNHHLWVLFWEGPRSPYRCYMHMARIRDEGRLITVEDLYLDVVVAHDGSWEVLDIDEFRQALLRGELGAEQTEAALIGLEHACQFVTRSRGDVERHLARILSAEVP